MPQAKNTRQLARIVSVFSGGAMIKIGSCRQNTPSCFAQLQISPSPRRKGHQALYITRADDPYCRPYWHACISHPRPGVGKGHSIFLRRKRLPRGGPTPVAKIDARSARRCGEPCAGTVANGVGVSAEIVTFSLLRGWGL